MSALGQKQTFSKVCAMSALPPIADMGTQPCNARFVPKADIEPFIRSPRRRAARLLREGDAERFEIEDH